MKRRKRGGKQKWRNRNNYFHDHAGAKQISSEIWFEKHAAGAAAATHYVLSRSIDLWVPQ